MSEYKKEKINRKVINACRGIIHTFKNEKNIRTHFFIALLVTMAGLYFNISEIKWLILILTITLVLSLEMLNTISEELCDLYTLDHNLHIKKIKDIAAGSVLLATIAAILVGLIIFLPYVYQ